LFDRNFTELQIATPAPDAYTGNDTSATPSGQHSIVSKGSIRGIVRVLTAPTTVADSRLS